MPSSCSFSAVVGQALEVAHRGVVYVDAADAAKAGLHLADAGRASVEAARTASQAGEQMEMANSTAFMWPLRTVA